MLEFLDKNKEWIFSGAGVTIITLMVVFGRKALGTIRPRGLAVKVQAAIVDMGLFGQIRAMAICVSNPGTQAVFLGNFFLKLNNGKQLVPLDDDVMRVVQQQRQLAPGQSVSFHITAIRLKSTGIPLEQFKYAAVQDAMGRVHRSSSKELRAVLVSILS